MGLADSLRETADLLDERLPELSERHKKQHTFSVFVNAHSFNYISEALGVDGWVDFETYGEIELGVLRFVYLSDEEN